MLSLQLVSGIEAVLGASSVSLLLRAADDPEVEAETYRAWSARRSVDGVFLTDLSEDDRRIPLVRSLGLPAVLIGGDGTQGVGLSRVGSDTTTRR